jgi:prolyl oligopeptidase
MGGSNGGLLMGVMTTQRPDLWNAVVCQVPLLDMLRYHLLLAGASWIGEYGDPDIAEERAFLETISPYHNVDSDADYPEVFFVTSTKDDRVHPGHARKMAALFEEFGHPFLYYENIDGGHSAAANLAETARRTALEYTYLTRKLMDPEEP